MSRSIEARFALQALGLLALLPILGCPTNNQGDVDLQGCITTLAGGFPNSGTVTIAKPTSCPFKLTEATTVPFAATATLPHATTLYGYYNAWVTDRQDNYTTYTSSPTWQIISSGTVDLIQISGNYVAGNGGFDGSNAGHDIWHHEFYASGAYVHASSRLTYLHGTAGATASGPGYSVPAYGSFFVTATTDDPLMVGPVTWDFYSNNSYIGSSSDGTFWVNTADPESQQTVSAIITDANSLTHTATVVVTICPANVESC